MNIEQMAREAGFDAFNDDEDRLPFHGYAMKHFAALVRAQALEEAAAVCDAMQPVAKEFLTAHEVRYFEAGVTRCAHTIRALKSDSKPLGGEG